MTSLRIAQRRGFLSLKESLKVKSSKKIEKKAEKETETLFRTVMKNWEKANKKGKRGTSWCWKTSLQIIKNCRIMIFLTAVRDGRFCWRLDNCLGAFYKVPMNF